MTSSIKTCSNKKKKKKRWFHKTFIKKNKEYSLYITEELDDCTKQKKRIKERKRERKRRYSFFLHDIPILFSLQIQIIITQKKSKKKKKKKEVKSS
jgi:hypothetical protein